MNRPVALGLLVVAAGAGEPSPVLAAPTSFAVSAAAAKACGLGTTSVALRMVNSNNVMTVTFTPSSVTAWCNTAGTLSISSTRLLKSGTTKTFLDYTLSVSGWGSTMTYKTAATLPPATTQSAATQSATLSLTCSTGCTAPPVPKNTTWNATVTLGLTAN